MSEPHGLTMHMHQAELIVSPVVEFRASGRFLIRRCLGGGAMGVVYAAYDRERNEQVALKTLLHVTPATIYRLKAEFRSLTDVAHPNLVSLYELMADGDQWFFTMELVDGVHFIDHVRAGRSVSALPSLPRLRDAMRQLALGVKALHDAGLLHRDLKPANVLVTPADRVVILDFGLVTQAAEAALLSTSDGEAGTRAYMAPEQLRGDPPTARSDWYAVGVMLHQALTGQLPTRPGVSGPARNGSPAERLDPGLPRELVELCTGLLADEPGARPTADAVLRCLGAPAPPAAAGNVTAAGPSERGTRLVGRASHLGELERAFELTLRGRPVSLYVHGLSGIGKTALIQHFLDRLQRDDRAVVLSGRCYEREMVPYKALDGVIDSLSRYLKALPAGRAEALMPRDVRALSQVFPVLQRVDAVASAPGRLHEVPDPWTLRQAAVGALRELLARMCDRQPVVIYIDDLHWADSDSTTILEELVRPPDAPCLLLLASFRSEELRGKPFLRSLLERAGSEACRDLEVGPLTPDDARTLASSILSDGGLQSRQLVERIVYEAVGSPFFVEQLARYAVASGGASGAISLGEMLEARLERQPSGAAELLSVLALAGRPTALSVASRAAGIGGDPQPLVNALRAAHFVRGSGTGDHIELYHDRIRETLAARLAAPRARALYDALVRAMEDVGLDDPEALFDYLLGAGDRERAARHALVAARKASAAVAFDRAAGFYRRALELMHATDAQRPELQASLGEALANAGRAAEAARAYLDAAALAEPAMGTELRRRAAEQLLMGGYVDEGLELTRSVLRTLGLRLAAPGRAALLSILASRAYFWLRGIGFRERAADAIPAADLRRIDIARAITFGIGLVDMARGAAFNLQHMRIALHAGEPQRIAIAFAIEAGLSAGPGRQGRARSARFAAAATELSRRVECPHAMGVTNLMTGVAAYLVGQWRRGARLCAEAEAILRDRCTGVVWELATAQNFLLGSLTQLGELRAVAGRLPALLAAANERGNLYAATELCTRHNIAWLADDDPDGGHDAVRSAMQRWSHEGFHRQHYNALLAMAQIELYTGEGPAVWQRVTAEWAALSASMYLQVQLLRIEALHMRARCALAAAAAGVERARLQHVAARLAARIAAERMAWADPLALLVRATLDHLRGDVESAATHLRTAADDFTAQEMPLHAKAAERRLGGLLAGDEGARLVARADAWMADQAIRDPARMTRMLVPGFDDA